MKELENDIDLFSMDAETGLDFLSTTKRSLDGIYRPTLNLATDKKVGYRAKIRFLPNFTKDGKIAPSATTKHLHYVNLSDYPQLNGYYDCDKNFGPKCDICTVYWKLKNSRNAAEVENAELIQRNTKYYSYILVLEDEQQKDLVGKIMIFSYGHKIKEKINAEKNGEVDGPCNVFDMGNGKDFRLIIKPVPVKGREMPNYDNSTFLPRSPIQLFSEKAQKFMQVPVNEEGKIVDKKIQEKLRTFLLERNVNLEDHNAVKWDDETSGKVKQVLDILAGVDMTSASKRIETAKNDTPSGGLFDTEEVDNFFDDFDEEK